MIDGRCPRWTRPLSIFELFSFLRILTVPILYLIGPGHQGSQSLVRHGFPEVRQYRQHIEQVVIGIDTICFRCFDQRVYNRTGFCTLYRITEQPVFSPYHKRADGIFSQMIGDGHISVLDKRAQSSFLISRI